MKVLNPKHLELVKECRKRRKELPSMHYIDMSDAQKRGAGERLAQAQISVFSASFWYDEMPMVEHYERFAIYKDLVKTVITDAFHQHKELKIGIAKQGGWQEYGPTFLSELKKIPENFKQKNSEYREGEFYLLSAAKSGIRLPGLFISSITISQSDPYRARQNKHQVKTYAVYKISVLDKKRGDHF